MTREEIQERLRTIESVLEECEAVINSRDSRFWEILRRTYRAQVEIYKSQAYSAAEDESKSIRNFLGRMEGLEWAIDLVEKDFLAQYTRAQEEKSSLQDQLIEVENLDRSVDSIISGPMMQPPGLI